MPLNGVTVAVAPPRLASVVVVSKTTRMADSGGKTSRRRLAAFGPNVRSPKALVLTTTTVR
jgi:hypothetical protein